MQHERSPQGRHRALGAKVRQQLEILHVANPWQGREEGARVPWQMEIAADAVRAGAQIWPFGCILGPSQN